MDVLLLHDPRELPLDLFGALSAAGHRVASHGGEPDALEAFLAAMRWRPEGVVVDFRGREARALDVARRVRLLAPAARLVLVHVPAHARADAERAAPGARVGADAAEALAALA